jgi:hypothetical protein
MDEYIEQFKEDGVVIIEGVLSPEEIAEARTKLHEQLATYGIDHDQIISGIVEVKDRPRIKSKASNIFCSEWKLLDIQLKDNIVSIMKNILVATFGCKSEGYDHPYHKFDDIRAFIDRVCYRLPDHIREEGGLAMHLDRNPTDPYLTQYNGLDMWRPIQAFVTLTDHYGNESGGLKIVKQFHREIETYFKDKEPSGNGSFFRMHHQNHDKLRKRCQPLTYVPAGSLVLWDNRLPHATCNKLTSSDSREVVYCGYIPAIPLNLEYLKKQAHSIIHNATSDRDWTINDLNNRQLTLLGLHL